MLFPVIVFCMCKSGFCQGSVGQEAGFASAGRALWAVLLNITPYYR